MQESYWHNRWDKNEISFHTPEANPLLIEHFGTLSQPRGSRVFVPLCGKTLDMHWLLAQGYRVVGAELSELAITQLFDDLGLKPEVKTIGALKHYSAEQLDIYVGNIFELTTDVLGPIDAIYDRAAIVALPENIRQDYTRHLMKITLKAPMLLISYVYDQNLMEGPPFSVGDNKVKTYYGDHYTLSFLASVDIAGGLKGKCPATENVWLMKRK